jgi:hypothetical protein
MFQTDSVTENLLAKSRSTLQWYLVRLAFCLLLTALDVAVVMYYGEPLLRVAVRNLLFLLLMIGVLLGLGVSLVRVWLSMFRRY